MERWKKIDPLRIDNVSNLKFMPCDLDVLLSWFNMKRDVFDQDGLLKTDVKEGAFAKNY